VFSLSLELTINESIIDDLIISEFIINDLNINEFGQLLVNSISY